MANKNKNEYEIELNNKKYTLRATFDFFMNVESELNKSFTELAMDSEKGKTTFNEAFVIIREGLNANNNSLSDDEIKSAILQNGLLTTTLQIQELMLVATYGGSALELLHKHSPLDDSKEEEVIKKK